MQQMHPTDTQKVYSTITQTNVCKKRARQPVLLKLCVFRNITKWNTEYSSSFWNNFRNDFHCKVTKLNNRAIVIYILETLTLHLSTKYYQFKTISSGLQINRTETLKMAQFSQMENKSPKNF